MRLRIQQYKPRLDFWILLFVLSMVGAACIWIATRWGSALNDDSFAYIKPARDILAGQGLNLNPLFPPLLTIALTILGFSGVDPWLVIRILNAVLFGATIFISGYFLKEVSGSAKFGVIAALLILTSETLIETYSWAMSEPLYMALCCLAMLTLYCYFKDNKNDLLWVTAVLAGLATVTRYAGFSLIGAILITLFLDKNSSKLKNILIFAGISFIPVGIYVLYNLVRSGQVFGSRNYSWQFPESSRLVHALGNVLTWFIPGRIVNGHELWIAVGILLLALLILIVGFAFYRKKLYALVSEVGRSPVLSLLLGFIVLNFLILIVLSGTFGKGDAFNNRYLSPVLLGILLLLAFVLATLWSKGIPVIRLVISISLFVMGGTGIFRSIETISKLNRDGAGFSSSRWHISETIAYLNKYPELNIISTGETGVYFWTGRQPLSVGNFGSEAEILQYECNHDAYLVVIDSMPIEFYGLDPQKLLAGQRLLYRFSEGSIYQCQSPTSAE